MADIIRLLSDAVANQIAAGEVIQRPASVIKELVENAIDAGATKIQVQLKDAGRTLVQVTDNGKGMSPTDARMAFERHATSKIHDAADLFAIKTMGFRGEALASIASVAEVELKTKREEDEIGTYIHIAASEVVKQEGTATANGTTFWVKNLFYNVPARRKFLKSNSTEIKHIITEIQRVALANPEIGISLHHNGTSVYDLPASNLRKRIVNIFGSGMNQSLVNVDSETSLAKISGFIGQPKFARKTFGEQYFFVNGRYMKHPFFHRAIMQAYDKILAHDMYPSYFIYFEVDPATIDINIHPTKTEIKFENESAIWQLLHAAVREGLGKFNVVPSIDFDQSGSFEMPIAPKSTDGLRRPEIEVDPLFNPFEERSYTVSSRGFSAPNDDDNLDNWEKLYNPEKTEENTYSFQQNTEPVQTSFIDTQASVPVENGRNLITLKNRYILSPVKSGLMVIDQRRAHQRILFEQFMASMSNHAGVCQQLLFPQTLEMNPSDAVLLCSMLDDLCTLGFDIREFGPNTFIVSGIPGILGNSDVKGILETLLNEFKTGASDMNARAKEKLATSLAIASSIDYGHQLSTDEAGALIDALFACATPNFSPTGKQVLEIIKIEELEKRFK